MTIHLVNMQFKDMHSRHHSLSSNNLNNEFDLCDIDLDSECVQAVIKIYSSNGKLTRNSVVKIMRKVYKLLPKLPNLTAISVPERGICTVVGDLHGQLTDLLYILEETGLPNEENRFIFNGDFVDRGEQSVEVVILLFLLLVVYGPEVVALNRGNHEDVAECRVYGFEAEVKAKYDDLLFEMFAEIFNHLPLFTVVNEAVFIVHGGLFHSPSTDIEDLLDINRADYFVQSAVPYPQCLDGLPLEGIRKA